MHENNGKKNKKNIDLNSFIKILEKEKEIIRIRKKVNTRFELAALVSKVDGGKAIIFENVEEKKIPVISNLLGTRKRFALALGVNNEKEIHNIINMIFRVFDICKHNKLFADTIIIKHLFYH